MIVIIILVDGTITMMMVQIISANFISHKITMEYSALVEMQIFIGNMESMHFLLLNMMVKVESQSFCGDMLRMLLRRMVVLNYWDLMVLHLMLQEEEDVIIGRRGPHPNHGFRPNHRERHDSRDRHNGGGRHIIGEDRRHDQRWEDNHRR